MKRKFLSLALLTASFGLQADTYPYHVGVDAGISLFDDESHLENSVNFGVNGAVYMDQEQEYALQVGYENVSDVAYEEISLKTEVHRFYANVLVDGEREYGVTPYLLFGGGYESLSKRYIKYTKTINQPFVAVGLGFKYQLLNQFNVNLETKILGMVDSETVDYVNKVGVDYMFGEARDEELKVIEALEQKKAKKVAALEDRDVSVPDHIIETRLGTTAEALDIQEDKEEKIEREEEPSVPLLNEVPSSEFDVAKKSVQLLEDEDVESSLSDETLVVFEDKPILEEHKKGTRLAHKVASVRGEFTAKRSKKHAKRRTKISALKKSPSSQKKVLEKTDVLHIQTAQERVAQVEQVKKEQEVKTRKKRIQTRRAKRLARLKAYRLKKMQAKKADESTSTTQVASGETRASD